MNLGDFDLGATLDWQFTTSVGGEPTTLVGGALAVYEGNNTTEFTTGLTLTVDFDGKTGTHNVHVVATLGNGFASGKNYTIRLTAGSVGGVTIAPCVLGVFSIENRAAKGAATNAAALLDLVDAIETGVTPRAALRLILAAEAGKVSGGGSSPVLIRAAVADHKVRINAVVDGNGNRPTVTTDTT